MWPNNTSGHGSVNQVYVVPVGLMGLEPPDLAGVTSSKCQGFFFSFPLFPHIALESTQLYPSKVFHRILRSGCKAVGPGGPDSISLWLFQPLQQW